MGYLIILVVVLLFLKSRIWPLVGEFWWSTRHDHILICPISVLTFDMKTLTYNLPIVGASPRAFCDRFVVARLCRSPVEAGRFCFALHAVCRSCFAFDCRRHCLACHARSLVYQYSRVCACFVDLRCRSLSPVTVFGSMSPDPANIVLGLVVAYSSTMCAIVSPLDIVRA